MTLVTSEPVPHFMKPKQLGLYVDGVTAFSESGQRVRLAPVQATALRILAQAYPRCVTYDFLVSEIWNYANEPANPTANLKVHITHLRKRIKRLGYLVTADWGFGYRLERSE